MSTAAAPEAGRTGPGLKLPSDRHKLVMGHVRLAYTYGRAMAKGLLPADEILDASRLATVEAAARWDKARGLKFKTYLRWYVHKHITLAVYGAAAVHVPVGFFYDYRRRTKGLDPHQVADREAARAAAERGWRALSLDSPDPWTGRSLAGSVPSRAAATDPDDLEALREYAARLDPRSRDILERYYGHGESFVSIGRHYGVSKQRVEQIRDVALASLRRMFHVPTPEVKLR